MKPFAEITGLRQIVTDFDDKASSKAIDPVTYERADRLINALKRTATGMKERTNETTLHKLGELEWLLGTLLGVPTDSPLPDSEPAKIRPVILGILDELERVFAAATFQS